MKNYTRLPIIQFFSTSIALVLLVGVTSAQQDALVTPAPAPSPTPAVTPQPAPVFPPSKIGGVTFSGSLRLRVESWDWFDTDKADAAYSFGAAVLRFGFSQSKESIEWQLEGEVPILLGVPHNAIAPAPQGQLGLGAAYAAANGRQDASLIFKQGFVRFKRLFGDKASSLKLGRFEFYDGAEVTPHDPTLAVVKREHIAQRLIGSFGFSHVGRSFDGVQFARNFKAGNFTFAGARPTAGVFQLSGNDELAVDFYYGAFTKPQQLKTSETEWRAFVLHYHDGRATLKTDNRAQALRTAERRKLRLTSFGGHHVGVYQAGHGKLDTLLWGAAQFGAWGNLAQRAGALAAEIGYSFGGSRWAAKLKPWLRAGYFRSTGDGNPADDKHSTFFQMLPTPRLYARTPFFNAMNNEDVFGQLRLKPQARLSLRFDAHHLRLSNRKDLWYAGGGAFQPHTFGYTGRPSSGHRSLGWLFDASMEVAVTSRTALTVYLSGIRGGGVPAAVYPLGGANPPARFFYFELTQKF